MESKSAAVSLILLLISISIAPIKAGAPCPPPPSSTFNPPNGNGNGNVCPTDALKLGACVDVLNGLVHVGIGDPKENKCCSVIAGLLEVEAAVCLCTAVKANVLGLNINIPLALSLLVTCGGQIPPGFVCPK